MWPFHKHDWYYYEGQQAVATYRSGWEAQITFVKRRCKTCHKLDRRELDGHWKLAELNGDAFDG